jgi:hypothetical protein
MHKQMDKVWDQDQLNNDKTMAAITPITIGRTAFGARTNMPFNQPAYAPPPPTIDYLIIAGGGGGGSGGGGNSVGGGGGAGGVVLGTGYTVAASRTYTVIIGGGGAAGPAPSTRGIQGSNTGFYATATAENTWGQGGGGGGGGAPADPSGSRVGGPGGSGGGGAQRDGGGGGGTPGQGNGGASGCNGPSLGNGGGGGGFGASGSKGLGPSDGSGSWPAPQPTSPFNKDVAGWSNGGLGGAGLSTTFDGTPRAYAGGGAGGGDGGIRSFGGRNGGPIAPFPVNEPFGGGESGSSGGGNRGGGGGGQGANPAISSAAGGSGIFWIRYPDQYCPIPNTTSLAGYEQPGTYRIYKWNNSGSWSWDAPGVNPAP